MIRNDQLQAAIISRLKANTTIVPLVTSGSFANGTWGADIREDTWKGTAFGYPNIRVKLLPMMPEGDKDCPIVRFSASLLVFSEKDSSMEADQIAGIINNELHGKTFVSNSIEISLRLSNLIPAVQSGEKTWRSEIVMNGVASG